MKNGMRICEHFRIVIRNAEQMKGARFAYVVGGILSMGKVLLSLVVPMIYKEYVELIQVKGTYAEILSILGPKVLLLLIIAPLVCYGKYCQNCCANLALKNMLLTVFSHTMRLPLSELENNRADKVMRATMNVDEAMEIFTGHIMSMIFQFLICFCSGLIILFRNDWRFALLGIFVCVIMICMISKLNVGLRIKELNAVNAVSHLAGHLFELANNLPMVKMLCIEDEIEKEFIETSKTVYKNRLRYKIHRGITDGILDFISYAAQASAIILGIMVLRKYDEFASLVYISNIFGLLLSGVRELGNAILFIQRSIVCSNRVYELLDIPIEKDFDAKMHPCPTEECAVEFNKVSYSYGSEMPVLHDVDIRIPYGKITAIVGESGCGKSTLMKLMERYYEPSNGDIKLGGISFDKLSNCVIRECFASVTQEPQLFDTTIKENIAWSRNIMGERMIQACKAAIVDMDYDYVVGERGGKLSGGQAQRVAIARALYKEADIYLFDEVTASLDNETEKQIHSMIRRILSGKTIIFVSHRLKTVSDADQIICMKNGHIVEVGTHEYLMQNKGYYSELYQRETRDEQ